MRQAYARLPHLKITELLLEIDHSTGFSRHFTHLKSQEPATDKVPLLTAILADAINLGLTKMAEACPGSTVARLSWLSGWHIRDETYSKALAEIVNSQHRLPLAEHWGKGTTSSSDGQRFRAGGRAEATGQVNGWTRRRVHSSQRRNLPPPPSGSPRDHPPAGHTQPNQDPENLRP
jgi:hypothetical protein